MSLIGSSPTRWSCTRRRGALGRRAGRARQGQARQAQLRVGRHRHRAASCLQTLNKSAGVSILHVPYRNVNDAMMGTVGGTPSTCLSACRRDRKGADPGRHGARLAVTTAQRSTLTGAADHGRVGLCRFVMPGWGGFLAPARRPRTSWRSSTPRSPARCRSPGASAPADRRHGDAGARSEGRRFHPQRRRAGPSWSTRSGWEADGGRQAVHRHAAAACRRLASHEQMMKMQA